MKRFLLPAAVFVAVLLLAMAIFGERRGGPSIERFAADDVPPPPAPRQKPPDPIASSPPEIQTLPPDVAREKPGASSPPSPGSTGYDTGIREDRRIRPGAEGKSILTEGVEIARRLHSSDSSPEEDLQMLDQLFGLFRLSFNENPLAGDNQMVMEALRGNNPGNLMVFPDNHPSLDSRGRLLDRWGTPYFFHALSGREMEIFSAGPDGEFNTWDDVQFSNRGGNPLTGTEDDTPDSP